MSSFQYHVDLFEAKLKEEYRQAMQDQRDAYLAGPKVYREWCKKVGLPVTQDE